MSDVTLIECMELVRCYKNSFVRKVANQGFLACISCVHTNYVYVSLPVPFCMLVYNCAAKVTVSHSTLVMTEGRCGEFTRDVFVLVFDCFGEVRKESS